MVKCARIVITNEAVFQNAVIYTTQDVEFRETPDIFSGRTGHFVFKCNDGMYINEVEDVASILLSKRVKLLDSFKVKRVALSGAAIYENVVITTNQSNLPKLLGPGQIAFNCEEGTIITNDYKLALVQIN